MVVVIGVSQVNLSVVRWTKPDHIKGAGVVRVVRLNVRSATARARLLCQPAGLQGGGHCAVCFVAIRKPTPVFRRSLMAEVDTVREF
jgi:hypothetical protein